MQGILKRAIPLRTLCSGCNTSSFSTTPLASSSRSTIHDPSTEDLTSHLNTLLAPLPPLPASLAIRLSTHKSSAGTTSNHNARLAFTGRRHLRCFLSLFLLQHADKLPPKFVKPGLIDQVLQLQTIGMRVGDRLQLEKSMRWVQIADQKGNSFWTIRGLGVESLVGGMTGYYGTAVTQQFFHSRILPALKLPPELASEVQSISQKDAHRLSLSFPTSKEGQTAEDRLLIDTESRVTEEVRAEQ